MPPFLQTDTVLVLGLDPRDFVERLASSVHLLVGVGSGEDVRSARREFAALDNVMFVEGNRDEIPWAAAQFSVIVDLSSLKPTPEMVRVLKAEGRIAQSV